MTMDIGSTRSRRTLLKTAAAVAAGAVATMVGRTSPARANTGDPLTLGHANSADAGTSLQGTGNTGVTLSVGTSDSGAISGTSANSIGIAGSSTAATGVYGQSVDGYGVDAASQNGWAARAMSSYGTGMYARCFDNTPSTFSGPSSKTGIVAAVGDTPHQATNTDEVGVYGFSDISANSTGVWGHSPQGVGVAGSGDWGVMGIGAVGVYALASSASGYALYTKGKIAFNGRSGRSSVASRHSYRDVTISGMGTGSAVIATLQTHASGIYVAAVVSYSGKFRLYLNKAATSTVAFSYLVIG